MSLKKSYWIAGLSLAGFLDAVYLTATHYSGSIKCTLSGCTDVLTSTYADLWGIPIALFGAIYYFIILITALLYIDRRAKIALPVITILPIFGFGFTLWLLYLQIFILRALCQYCLLSALISTILFILSLVIIKKNKKLESPQL